MWSGTSTYYGGGGAAGQGGLSGGLGGGGATYGNGLTNTGGGAGGGSSGMSMNGGSGIVLIRILSGNPLPKTITGTYSSTTSQGYTVYTFTNNGSIAF